MIATIDFKSQVSKEECAFENWKETVNELNFTGSFVDMFKTSEDDPWPIEALWAMYYCLKCILACCDENGEAGDLQVFFQNGKKFWVKTEGKTESHFLSSGGLLGGATVGQLCNK